MSERTDPSGFSERTGSTTTLHALADRGSPRGATAVLRGARRDVVRHERRRAVVGGVAVAAVLTGAVGAAVYLAPDDESRPLGAGSGPPPAGGPQTLTGITVEGHEGFDRVVLRFNVDEAEQVQPGTRTTMPSSPACRDFDPLDRSGSEHGALVVPYISATAAGEDGLVPGLADTPVAGDTTYVKDVTALCAADGHAWVVMALTEASNRVTIVEPSEGLSPGELPSEPPPSWAVAGTCPGEDPGELYVDFYYEANRPDGTCPPPPA